MNDKEYTAYLQSSKWRAIAKRRFEIDNYTCQMCGSRGTPNNPLEVHHLSYKHIGNEQDRIYEDLETLCHTCHKLLHNAMNRKTAPNRRGWSNNQTIPQVHVFTFSGLDQERREVNNNEQSV